MLAWILNARLGLTWLFVNFNVVNVVRLDEQLNFLRGLVSKYLREFHGARNCVIWLVYAEVVIVQSFTGRRPKSNSSSDVKVIRILRIIVYSTLCCTRFRGLTFSCVIVTCLCNFEKQV